jgi:hypothetical protein
MIDAVLRNSFTIPKMSGGKIFLSEDEIKYVVEGYALYGAGYDHKTTTTEKFHVIQRENKGMKLWGEMTVLEKKREVFSRLRKDLENTTFELSKGDRANFLLKRTQNTKDPFQNFYILLLIKLGAQVDDNGSIVNYERLVQKLEVELEQRQLIDLVPVNELEQDRRLDIRPNMDIRPDWGRD